ncbi:MAG TPA: energy transducer TonB [Burkholderiaceae bacterium]|nr:energy transducer TonB [Burkholderiaceae bacterium]
MTQASGKPVLRAPGGARKFQPKSYFGPIGLSVMVAAHLLIGYALATGLARQAFEIVKKPLDATIIQEVKLPPPPPPPPPPMIEKVKPAPKAESPPPPTYVPPPDIQPAVVNPAPAIAAVQTAQPVAPPPAAPAPAAPAKADIAIVCPKQVRPEMPQRALDDGISGTVKAEVHVRSGRVVDVKILSGPRVFHAGVRAAMLRYECASGDTEVVATQDFTFKVD